MHKFFLTDAHTSEKILKSARLEEIRLTILNNLLQVPAMPLRAVPMRYEMQGAGQQGHNKPVINSAVLICGPSSHCGM